MGKINYVQVDISIFVAEVFLAGENGIWDWAKNLAHCLATNDPERSDYGAMLLAEAQSYIEENHRKKSEAGRAGARKRWQAMAKDSTAMAMDSNAMQCHASDIAEDSTAMAEVSIRKDKVSKGKEIVSTTHVLSKGGVGENRKRFAPPTPEEAIAYGMEIGLPSLEVEKWIDYYASKGWIVGKSPMKDWKATMRNWKRNWRPPQSTIEAPPEIAWAEEQMRELKARERHG